MIRGTVPSAVDPPPAIEPSELGRFVPIVLLGGLVFDFARRADGAATLGVGSIGIFTVIGVLVAGVLRFQRSQVAIAMVVLPSLALTLRSDSILTLVNLVAATLLALYSVALNREKRVWWSLPGAQIWADVGAILDSTLSSSSRCRSEIQAQRSNGKWNVLPSTMRGLLIAVPVVVLLVALLSAGDAVFAESIAILSPGQVTVSLLAVVTGAILTALWLFVAQRGGAAAVPTPSEEDVAPRAMTEFTITLGAIAFVYVWFALAQLDLLVDVQTTLDEAGLTYAEYAREGFFQLLWASGLTFVVVVAAVAVALPVGSVSARSKPLRILAAVVVLMTLALVGVSVRRLGLYIGVFGLSPLRFYSLVIAGSIAIAMVLLLARLHPRGSRTAWFTSALACGALVVVLSLNLAAPQAQIVEYNLSHQRGVTELAPLLDGSGLVALVEGLDRVEASEAPQVHEELCRASRSLRAGSMADWNLERRRAIQALTELCGS